MPTYEVDVGGKTYEVDAPDSNTAWQWANYTHTQAPKPKQSTFLGEAERGAKQLLSSARTGFESLVSPEEAAIKGVGRAQNISAEAGEGPSLEAVTRAYKERGLLPAAGEVISQIPKALAGQGANLAAMAGGARLGAMAGAPFGPIGVGLGGAAGAGLALLPQFAGANVERQAQEQQEAGKPVSIDRTKAYGAAAGQAAIEGAGTAFVLGKGLVKGVLGIADDAALTTAKAQAELVRAAERSLSGTVARGAARGAVEIPVEIAQQILERAQAGLSLTGRDAYNEYGEAAYLAGLTGGVMGGVGSVVNRGQAQSRLQDQAAQQEQPPETPPETPSEKPLQLGMNPPVAFPDGTVATSPEDVQRYREEQFRKQYESEPVKPPQQLDFFNNESLSRATPEEIQPPRTVETPQELEALRAKDERAAVKASTEERKAQEEAGQATLGLRRTPEGQPTASGQPERNLTGEDIMLTAIPLPKPVQQWVEKNVVGQTLTRLREKVDADPTLVEGRSPRAQLLKTLLAPEVPAFEEAPSVPPTKEPTVKPAPQPRGSKPSVAVPSEPAVAGPKPTGGVAPTRPAGASAKPVGRGLVPTGQPVSEGRVPAVAQPSALTTPPAKPTVAKDTPEEVAQRKAEAESMRKAMEMQDKAYAKGPAPTGTKKVAPAQPTKTSADRRQEQTAQEDQDWKRVLDRVMSMTSAFNVLGARTEEASADKSPRIGKTEQFGTQGTLFPMSKDNAKRDAQRKPAAAEPQAEPAKTKDERQMDLVPRKNDIAKWASEDDGPKRVAVYSDNDVALVRKHADLSGGYVYTAKSRKTGNITTLDIENARFDSDRYKDNDFTEEQIERLRKMRTEVAFEESKQARKNPNGPFTGAKSNVVGSDSVDPRYVGYLQNLMQSMGLEDVRVFLVHPEDVRATNAVEKYKLYGNYVSVRTAGDSSNEEGSTRVYGKDFKDFYISFKPGMTEGKSVEVISHELGHMIEKIALDKAPPAVKAAIKKEHEAWLLSTKGKTGREMVQMLRNRETADTQMLSVDEGKTAEQMDAYWKLFTEWFADNTSRWASTSEKPISVTEKFFAKVAQMMRDLVAVMAGRKYPPNTLVADFLDKMGPGSADLWLDKTNAPGAATPSQTDLAAQFSVSPTSEQIIKSMGPLSATDKSLLEKGIEGFNTVEGIDFVTQLRTQQADSAAAIESRFSKIFNGAVRDKMGKFNPMGLYRQAQDHAKLLLDYFQRGAIEKDATTGQWRVADAGGKTPVKVYSLIDAYAKKNGISRERATQTASRVLEAYRLDGLLKANPDFPSHLSKAQITALVADYNADPAFAAMNDAMDAPRKAMIAHMVTVGRLTKEMAKEWSDVAGYVPFDRENFGEVINKFASRKKLTGKSPLAISTNPELVGSASRPVGNVFDNYINTLGWMVKEVMNNDARVTVLNGLQDLGAAKDKGRVASGPNVVGAYVDGEMQYWELPSKYDVMAFKDLNPPKWAIMRFFGEFSKILRTTVTILPPFALKQVTDDIQRGIFTSGVKDPLALVRMSLVNFPKLALAELRGIQHPYVKDFGAMGLTGEFDFQEGRPAASLLADLKITPRGPVKELIHRLNGITRASDLSVRKAIYDQTLVETKDQLLAQTRAREFINFRRRGSSEFASIMTTTIPFYNSYVQGMDVLYRAASGIDSSASIGRAEARKLFINRAAIAVMLSTIYAMGKNDDDEDYREMDLRTRDNNWIIGNGIKLPVPGELGAIFKVIPERVVEYYKRQGTPEEQEAFEVVRTTMAYMFEQYVGRVLPIPQAAKPLLESFTNHSFLTGRELEGIHQKGMLPYMRRTTGTSELAVAMAKFAKDTLKTDVSPIMIDNTLRGYFGSTTSLVTMVTDSMLNPTRMDRPLHKWALVSNYAYDPVGTRRTSEFYEEREKVAQASNTLKDLAKTDIEAAEKFAMENEQKLILESAVTSTLNQIEQTRAYRKYLESKEAAEEMTQQERQDQMKEVRKYEVEMVSWLREAKAEIRKQASQ